jgi:hypothetical protein
MACIIIKARSRFSPEPASEENTDLMAKLFHNIEVLNVLRDLQGNLTRHNSGGILLLVFSQKIQHINTENGGNIEMRD